jgi:hypothetical protein
LDFMREFHEKLHLMNAFLHHPGKDGVYYGHVELSVYKPKLKHLSQQ